MFGESPRRDVEAVKGEGQGQESRSNVHPRSRALSGS
jgi:hypothetical protein